MLNEKDIQTFTKRSSGPGGQHVNTTDSCVVMRHLPTGIEAKAASKSQHQNRKTAREVLEARVKSFYSVRKTETLDKKRNEDRGSGMRGDKVRTYRDRDDVVTDHRSEVKVRLRDVRAGKLEGLWD